MILQGGDFTKNRTEQNTRETVTLFRYRRDSSRTICVIYSPKRGQSPNGTKLIIMAYFTVTTKHLSLHNFVDVSVRSVLLIRKSNFSLLEYYYILDSNFQGKIPPWDRNLRTQYNVTVSNRKNKFYNGLLRLGTISGFFVTCRLASEINFLSTYITKIKIKSSQDLSQEVVLPGRK